MDEHAALSCGLSALIVVAASVLLHRPDAQIARGPTPVPAKVVPDSPVVDVKPAFKSGSPAHPPKPTALYVSIREPEVSSAQADATSPEGARPASRASSRASSAWRSSASKFSRP